jgi:hypothetical protein
MPTPRRHGVEDEDRLATQLAILLDGAIATALVRGNSAMTGAAKEAAANSLRQRRRRRSESVEVRRSTPDVADEIVESLRRAGIHAHLQILLQQFRGLAVDLDGHARPARDVLKKDPPGRTERLED